MSVVQGPGLVTSLVFSSKDVAFSSTVLPFVSTVFFFKIRDKGIICPKSQLIRSGLYPFRINPK